MKKSTLLFALLLFFCISASNSISEDSKTILQYKKALEADPGNTEVRYLLGMAQLKARDYQAAIENLNIVHEAGKEDARLIFGIGFAHQNLGQLDDALVYYQKVKGMTGVAGALKEELSSGFFNLGLEYHEKKELDKAIANYRESLALLPQEGAAYCLIGVAYYQKREYQQSLQNFETCLKSDGKENSWAKDYAASIYEMKGLEYIKNKELKSAAKEFENILKIMPGYEKARYYQCYIRYVEGDIYNAGSCLAGLKGLKEQQVQEGAGIILFNIGIVLQDNGDWNGSIRALKDAIFFRPGDIEQHLYLGKAYIETKDYDNALLGFQEAWRLDPDNKDAEAGAAMASDKALINHLRAGKDYLNAREFQKAIEEFDKVLAVEPNHKEAVDAKEKAEGELRTVLIQTEKKKQDAVGQRIRIAREALKANEYNKAIASYSSALKLDKDNQEAIRGLQKANLIKAALIDKNLKSGKEAYEAKSYYQAISHFTLLLKIEPGHDEARKLLHQSQKALNSTVAPLLKAGEELYNNGDIEKAAAQFKKILNIEPDNAAARSYLSRLDDIFAKKALEKEVQRLYLKGIDLYTKGSYADAITLWEDILKIEPRHEKALLNIQKAKRMIKSTGTISGVRG
ncbi:MAG: tetratricopeptide repeat protein [Deltaproteobacteria bacterium]|nr:tetratricopeptide repeat protein [Deltaproteobacteria bacterium]